MERKPVVLVVDDERSTVRLLEINLDAEGYDVLTAYSGVQALQQSVVQPPDVVILDVIMPDMDGYEVLSRLRDRPETANVSVIVLSGLCHEDEIADGWAHEIDLYVTKPYNIEDLLTIVDRLVEDREQEQMLAGFADQVSQKASLS